MDQTIVTNLVLASVQANCPGVITNAVYNLTNAVVTPSAYCARTIIVPNRQDLSRTPDKTISKPAKQKKQVA